MECYIIQNMMSQCTLNDVVGISCRGPEALPSCQHRCRAPLPLLRLLQRRGGLSIAVRAEIGLVRRVRVVVRMHRRRHPPVAGN
jgi:hypothetical protein